jgi:hypothetical protein
MGEQGNVKGKTHGRLGVCQAGHVPKSLDCVEVSSNSYKFIVGKLRYLGNNGHAMGNLVRMRRKSCYPGGDGVTLRDREGTRKQRRSHFTDRSSHGNTGVMEL